MKKEPRVPANQKLAAKAAKRTYKPLVRLAGAARMKRSVSAKSPEYAARRASVKKVFAR